MEGERCCAAAMRAKVVQSGSQTLAVMPLLLAVLPLVLALALLLSLLLLGLPCPYCPGLLAATGRRMAPVGQQNALQQDGREQLDWGRKLSGLSPVAAAAAAVACVVAS
eukprot:scaffold192380_cov17-Tisochrysis_lutea.AAC.2